MPFSSIDYWHDDRTGRGSGFSIRISLNARRSGLSRVDLCRSCLPLSRVGNRRENMRLDRLNLKRSCTDRTDPIFAHADLSDVT